MQSYARKMENRSSKKSYWECKHGCPVSNTPCKHLERLLTPMKRGTYTKEFKDEYKTNVLLNDTNVSYRDTELVKILADYGLKVWEIDLLLGRYVENLSLRDISKRYGYLDNKKVWRLLEELTERLSKSPVLKKLLLGRITNEV
jgi:hypothetical protein